MFRNRSFKLKRQKKSENTPNSFRRRSDFCPDELEEEPTINVLRNIFPKSSFIGKSVKSNTVSLNRNFSFSDDTLVPELKSNRLFQQHRELLNQTSNSEQPNNKKYSDPPFPSSFKDDFHLDLRGTCNRRVRPNTGNFSHSSYNCDRIDIKGVVYLTFNDRCYKLYKNDDFIYENDILLIRRYKEKSNALFKHKFQIKSVKLNKREVELTSGEQTIFLVFSGSKEAKLFCENEQIQKLLNEKVTITNRLLKLIGKRSSREILESKGIYKSEEIFGNSLQQLYSQHNEIPEFIREVIKLIELPQNISTVGLYRTSGNMATIQKIRIQVDLNKLDILNEYIKDVDVLAGSLKLFFRELIEPLISNEVCQEILDLMNNHSSKKYTLQKILSKLHEANQKTLYTLIKHLLKVIEYKDQNKMDVYNLSVCWGQTVIFFSDSNDLVTQSTNAISIFEFLMNYFIENTYELDMELKDIIKNAGIHSSRESLKFKESVKLKESLKPKETLKRKESVKSKETVKRMGSVKPKESLESLTSKKSQDSIYSYYSAASSLKMRALNEVLTLVVENIEENMDNDGLYQKSGSSAKKERILRKMFKNKVSDLEKIKIDSVYDWTDALKKYLREDPLITKDILEEFIICDDDVVNEDNVLRLLEKIPKKETLAYIVRHILKVIANEHLHKVPKDRMIDIWSKVLCYQKQSPQKQIKFLKTLLNIYDTKSSKEILPKMTVNNNFQPDLIKDIQNSFMKKSSKNSAEFDEHSGSGSGKKDSLRCSTYENLDGEESEVFFVEEKKIDKTKL